MPDPIPVPQTHDPLETHPLIEPGTSDEAFGRDLFAPVWSPKGTGWWVLLMIGLAGTGLLVVSTFVTVTVGIGSWGNNIPIAWGFGITNFVWWIGIGHAGTLISAILLLLQQKWRTSINRFAEAMTLFAVACAGMYPVLHLGRPWLAYWLIPYPNKLSLYPQFKSPLTWDLFAISTYFTVSFLFWYLGMIPDLAALRDTSPNRRMRKVYGVLAFGWRGSGRQWQHWRIGYLLLAALATPLVVSVHTIVSFDFAVGITPGWHATIFPPYFVAGAVFSGFAMVVTLIVPARRLLNFKNVVTLKHLDNMNKVILATGLMVSYGYLTEHFIAWYSGSQVERYVFWNRAFGPYNAVYWTMIACNVLVPQIFWSKGARTNIWVMWIASIAINVGMWSERFIIIITSLHREYLPSMWRMFFPTWVDWGLFLGTIGFFMTGFLLFLRFLPPIPVAEVRELGHELREHEAAAFPVIRTEEHVPAGGPA